MLARLLAALLWLLLFLAALWAFGSNGPFSDAPGELRMITAFFLLLIAIIMAVAVMDDRPVKEENSEETH